MEPKEEFIPEPLHILDKREVQLRKRTIVQLKVQWKHFEDDEATLGNEATMREAYPSLFHDFNTESVEHQGWCCSKRGGM